MKQILPPACWNSYWLHSCCCLNSTTLQVYLKSESLSRYLNLKQSFPWKMGTKGQISLMQFFKGDRPMAQLRCSHICLLRSCNFTSTLSTLTRFSSILLAPSGALIAIPTYYWPIPTFSDNTPVLNTGLSLSEPLQLYQGQSLDSSAGFMYTSWEQQGLTAR